MSAGPKRQSTAAHQDVRNQGPDGQWMRPEPLPLTRSGTGQDQRVRSAALLFSEIGCEVA